ncbi:MAG: non-ribosomal peptide synthetase [Kibdelosporangium sp.]
MSVLTALFRQCQRVPGRTAIVVGAQSLTYHEFGAATAQLAGRLRARGVRPGQVVVLYQRQRIQAVVGMIAALRIGAAWCVADPGHPKEMTRALLGDVDCGALVFDGSDETTPPDVVRELAGSVPVYDTARPGSRSGDIDVPVPENAPAYVITTSGSTGVPKAVVISRASLEAMIAARDYPYRDGDLVTFSAMRLTWDGSLMKTLWAFTVGGTAVLPSDDELSDVDASARLAAHWRVTHLVATPSYYRMLLPRLESVRPHLRLVTLAGEALPVNLAQRHRDLLPDAELNNEYGPTEVTVSCVSHRVHDIPESIVPIGRAMPGNSAHVLDERLRPVPPGGIGELYLGGLQVGQGYAARPDATSARFVADPFSSWPGGRLYRTGDLVRLDGKGDTEFHGRADGQVKVRGARVERHAVELALESHPAIRQAVVLGTPDEHGELSLAAFWVPAGTATALPTTAQLVTHCAERLVAQAVPDVFVAVGSVPLMPNSKVDEAALRAMLPAPDNALPGPARHRWTAAQQSVGQLWAAVLRHEDFGLTDGFFDVGGNSRRVVDLHVRFERQWPGAVRVGQLFDLVTVAGQADAIAGRDPAGRAPSGGGPAAERRKPATFEV